MWILIPIEYFLVTKRSSIITNVGVALFVTCTVYFINGLNICSLVEKFLDNSISALSLLVGFTVAIFTLLISAGNPNIEEIKKTNIPNLKMYGEEVSIFKVLLVRMSYLIFIESVLLLLNLLFPFIFGYSSLSILGVVSVYISIFLLVHVIITNISNILDIYFILTKSSH